MSELQGNAAMTGGVSNIITLMRERDEAHRAAELLRRRNLDLVERVEFLLQRLREAGVNLNETGESE